MVAYKKISTGLGYGFPELRLLAIYPFCQRCPPVARKVPQPPKAHGTYDVVVVLVPRVY